MITLPTMSTPKYTTKLSNGKSVSYRAFLVKEEKLLLIAHQTGDLPTILVAIKDLVKATTFDTVDVEKLSTIDLIWLLIKIRSKSVGEVAKFQIKCRNESCGKDIECAYDLDSIEMPDYSTLIKKIQLTDDIGVIMRLPTTKVFTTIIDKEINNTDKLYKIIANCIESIYTKDEVMSADDVSEEDINKFVENLTHNQFDKLKKFYETIPMITKNIVVKCPHCGHETDLVLKGLFDFFV